MKTFIFKFEDEKALDITLDMFLANIRKELEGEEFTVIEVKAHKAPHNYLNYLDEVEEDIYLGIYN